MPRHASLTPPTDTAQAAKHADYYRQALHELIDMGMDLSRQVHAAATTPAGPASSTEPQTPPNPAPALDATLAFDRVARAVRRCISLARRLDEPVFTRHHAADHAAQHHAAARRRIIRDVEDAIERRAPGNNDGQSLHDELLERLDGPDLDDDIDLRPTADIVADLCRDLGLIAYPGPLPWKRRTPVDIATLCARAAAPPPDPARAPIVQPERFFHLVAPSKPSAPDV